MLQIGLALLLAAGESPDRYTATATLRVGQRQAQVRVTAEDIPFPGDMNRWRYVFAEADVRELLAGFESGLDRPARVCGAVVVWPGGRGGQYMEAAGAWRLELRPVADGVAAQLAAAARPERCRAIEWSVHRAPGRTEIVLEERASFGTGRTAP